MRLIPLEQFVCDECGEIIPSIQAGWVEWLEEDGECHSFRIVHHRAHSPRSEGCYHNDGCHVQDMHLDYFLGNNGLVILLSIMEIRQIRDPKEYADIIRRLHIPYYEEARQYWGRSI